MKASVAKSGYIYRLAGNDPTGSGILSGASRLDLIADGVVRVDFSANLGVIKTLPGYANSVAIMIDTANPYEIIGTVAGDDTILLIIREGVVREDITLAIKAIIPKLEGKI
jgi:transcriptional regulator of arginine metabolism